MAHAKTLRLCLLFLTLACCFAQDAKLPAGSIAGEVFNTSSDGQRAVVPGAVISLSGPVERQTESDASGQYRFELLPPGRYTAEANAPGLKGAVPVDVAAGETAAAPISIELTVVATSVTVTAADSTAVPATEQSAQSTTIAQSTVENAPNRNDTFESLLPLVPGVVRGPDGHINMKGARSTQAGWLVNSANVTDPATGAEAMNLPIDVVSSIQVISNSYDPAYGRFTGAVSSVETKPGRMDKFHFSMQNLFPRARKRDGTIAGIESFTPRLTVTGPLIKNRVAITQSFEYRFVRTPVQSLPPLRRDMKQESFDSFTQVDVSPTEMHTATFSFSAFPQKLAYVGLNTFTPQESTSDLHQRGYEASMQDRYIFGAKGLLTSQVNLRQYDADILPNSTAPYRLLLETTEGGFFDRQRRRSRSVQWQEIYQAGQWHFLGTHTLKAGLDFSRSDYDGRQSFSPIDVVGATGRSLQRIDFGSPTSFSVGQTQIAWFAGDQWQPCERISVDLGLRFDRDSITDATHAAPRGGVTLALTRDRRTLLKAGGGLFYDRVPLNIPAFPEFPGRTVHTLGPRGEVLGSTAYTNTIFGSLGNPRSAAWNIELDRQVLEKLAVRIAYQKRRTRDAYFVNPDGNFLTVANGGRDSYREFQITGAYQIRSHTVNASYARSRAYGDLNDFNQFFGNNPAAVIQPNARGRLSFDAPNRFLIWGEIAAPKKISVFPVLDLHTGFPYSNQNELREYIGPRNVDRYPRFASLDLQLLKEIHLPGRFKNRTAKVGAGVFNLLNSFNPRDVQNNMDSYRYGSFFNSATRSFRGKFVLGF
ncbi:MAG: carboxypeptidase regulatory-like domain-containing protein [Acidobacteriota bacterium]